MLFGFVGRVSSANQLKESLDASSRRTRQIADRVANATLLNADGFALPAANAAPGSAGTEGAATAPVDIEAEMVSLADEQLRYEATAKLLEKTYQRLRASIRDR